MSKRSLYPLTEMDSDIYGLIKLIGKNYVDWDKTSFKAIPKDVVSAHTLKW